MSDDPERCTEPGCTKTLAEHQAEALALLARLGVRIPGRPTPRQDVRGREEFHL